MLWSIFKNTVALAWVLLTSSIGQSNASSKLVYNTSVSVKRVQDLVQDKMSCFLLDHSRVLFCDWMCGDQTTEAYSSIGLTYVI